MQSGEGQGVGVGGGDDFIQLVRWADRVSSFAPWGEGDLGCCMRRAASCS